MLSRSVFKKIGVIIAVLIVAGVLGEVLFYHPAPTSSDSRTPPPYFDYIVVIVLENKNLNQVYGTSCSGNCSYITQLADSHGLAKNYSGVAHGSMPNYMTLTSGGNYSYLPYTVNCYGVLNETCQVNSKNIADAVEKTGRTWKVYITNYGSSGCKPIPTLPFVFYTDVYYNATRCSKLVDASPFGHNQRWDVIPTTLLSDLNSPAITPNFMWLVPSGCDVGYCVRNSTTVLNGTCDNRVCFSPCHSPSFPCVSQCGNNSTTFAACVSQSNEYLSLVVPQILSSTIFRTQNAVLFITWDEGGGINGFGGICPQKGQTYPTCIDTIPAIFAGPHVKRSYVSDPSFSSLDAGAVPMTSFFDLQTAKATMPFFDTPVLGYMGREWILAEEICRRASAAELQL